MCQTLWTDRKDLIKDSFSWLTPQHHLMGWALSSLKLSQHYKTVQLYTDSVGKEMLVDRLGFPYTDVFVNYDNLDCKSYLWAFPKLLTYAKQNQPFLHVDADVIVWKPFNEALLSNGLIAQNLEKGTEYYRNRFDPLLSQLKNVPPHLKQNLTSNNMRGYNAGIIGGSDIPFFKRFVSQATRFVEINKDSKLDANFNMIFEQLLFCSMAGKEKNKVACLIDQVLNDNGYKTELFADFPNIEKLEYLHLIGPFKRNKEVCDWLARYLRRENEDVFLSIIALFKKQHYFYSSKLKEAQAETGPTEMKRFRYVKSESLAKSINPEIAFRSGSQLDRYITKSENVVLKELFKYEKKIHRICAKFSKIQPFRLKQMEDDTLNSVQFLVSEREERKKIMLCRNPHIEIIHTAYDWATMQISQSGIVNIRCSYSNNIVIGIVPELFFSGYREVTLDETCVNIIVLTEECLSYNDLLKKIEALFSPLENEREYDDFCELIFVKVGFLIKNKLLFIHEEH